VRGAFGDPDRVADLAKADAGVMRDAKQHLGVVSKKRPAGRSVLEHDSRLAFLDFDVMYAVRDTERETALMPHFKCVRCRTRLYSESARADLVGDLCPCCGSLLEPVGELAEIVGFQSIQELAGAPDDGPTSRPERLANRVDRLFARRQAMLAQKPAVAEAIALAAPDEDP
jgi:hypothetical protein